MTRLGVNMFSVFLGIHLGIELQDHVIILCLTSFSLLEIEQRSLHMLGEPSLPKLSYFPCFNCAIVRFCSLGLGQFVYILTGRKSLKTPFLLPYLPLSLSMCRRPDSGLQEDGVTVFLL